MTIIRTFTDGDDRFAINSAGTYDLTFLGGNDRLAVRAGTVTAHMGVGDDFVHVDGGLANLYGQAGNDRFEIDGSGARVDGGRGNDFFVLGGGTHNVLLGGDGNDRFNLTSDASNVRISGDAGNDIFYGHSHSISGSVFGGAGDDRFLLFGNHGGRQVTLYGGVGDDIYRISPNSPATIVEYAGEGVDTVQVAVGSTYTLGANLEDLVVSSFAHVGAETHLTGNDLANRITGGNGRDFIDGMAGDDRIYGLGGNDGINGGAGDDIIYGGMGADGMVGGPGSDIFAYASAAEGPYDPFLTNVDWITGWEASDRIDVSAIDANAQIAGIQHFNVVNGDGHEPGTLYWEGDPAGWGWIFITGYIDSDDQPDFFVLITETNGYPPVTNDSFIVG